MFINKNCRYVALTGNDIPFELYNKIIELDSEIFSNDSDEFEGNTAVNPDTLKSYLEKNILTTTIIYDQEKDEVIAYYQAFPLEAKFMEKYVNGKTSFSEMTADDIECFVPGKEQNLYIWSIGIKEEYRGKCVLNDTEASALRGKNPMKVLIEGLAGAMIDLKKQGVIISEIYAEGVSEKGKKLASELTDNRLLHEDVENDFYLYGNKFKFENMVKRLPEEVKIDLMSKWNSVDFQRGKKLGDNLSKLIESENKFEIKEEDT